MRRIALALFLILLDPVYVSPGENDPMEMKLREAHQRLALSYIELIRLDPRPPVNAYLTVFYDLNKGPFEVKE